MNSDNVKIEWELNADSVAVVLVRDGVSVKGRECDLRVTSCEYGADADGRRGEMLREAEVVKTCDWATSPCDPYELPSEDEMLDYWMENYHD